MVSDRSIRGAEGPTNNDNSAAFHAEVYHHSEIQMRGCGSQKATPDSGKTNEQLNNELQFSDPIYDLQKGIKSDSRTRHDLSNAIEDASFGNIDAAMAHLRQATTDLNAGGTNIDSGLSKLGDGGRSAGSQTIQRGMVNESDCSQNIQKAEQLLREGDTEGAIKAMTKGIREVAHRQHQTRDGIASLQGDDNDEWNSNQQFSPGRSGSYEQTTSSNNGFLNNLPGFGSALSGIENSVPGLGSAMSGSLPGLGNVMSGIENSVPGLGNALDGAENGINSMLQGLPNIFGGGDNSSSGDNGSSPGSVVKKLLDPLGFFG